ncbi:MAG: glycosyltransferase family 2 protein [Gluconobacter japonicus]|uniref:glycosyltransferase family 2 protein n=1 Tax=Gluconobacter japonicus TaxID=376620 RepID=UPI0039EBBDB8
MLKTAAVLFVHNEVDNIGWWISHHRAIGFSTLIICDDHSTDGTWTVLSSAASFHDIRLHRSDAHIPDRLERQNAFQEKALRDGRSAFDWMMILAADEYLHFEESTSLEDFLSSVTDNTQPVHWCLFGSNGHEEPSPFAPTQAFTRHAPLETADHRVIRTFIRAEDYEGPVPDPLSCLNFAPNWSRARILHYAAGDRRSFLKRHSSATPENAWNHFNRNDVLDTSAQRWLRQTRQFAASIVQAGLTDLYWRLRQMIVRNDEDAFAKLGLNSSVLFEHEDVSFPDFKFYALGQTTQLALDLDTEDLVTLETTALDAARYVRLLLMIETSAPALHPTYLITERLCAVSCLDVEQSPCLLPIVPLKLDPEKRLIASPLTGQDVALPIPDQALVKQMPSAELSSRITALTVLCQGGHTLAALLRGLERLPTPDATALGCAIAMLPPEDAERLSEAFPGLVPRNIRPAKYASPTP